VTLQFPLVFGESIYQFASPRFKYHCSVFPSFGYDNLGCIYSSINISLATGQRKGCRLSEPLYTGIYSRCKIIC